MNENLKKVTFNQKNRLLTKLYKFHDYDCSLVFADEKTLKFVQLDSGKLLFQIEFKHPILDSIIINESKQMKGKQIITFPDINPLNQLEELKLELIDFYLSDTNMIISASKINPNFKEEGKKSFYLNHIYIELNDFDVFFSK